MELVFQESPLRYLNRILCDRYSREETRELIVPDSLPDAREIIEAFGTVMIRSRECTGGTVTLAGVVEAGVIFLTAEGQTEVLHTQLPFTHRQETGQEEVTAHCACTLTGVDARLLNSRKILLRAGIGLELRAYEACTCSLTDFPEPSPRLRLRRTELPVCLPAALGEGDFTLNEEAELPGGKPSIRRLLRVLYRPEVGEEKAVGTKAVFKGSLHLHILYEDMEDRISACTLSLPFSQYTELSGEAEGLRTRTLLSLTSAETELQTQPDCRRLLISAAFTAQTVAWGEQKLNLISDGFCTDGTLTPTFRSWEMTGLLDSQSFRDTVSARCEASVGEVVSAWVCTGEPAQTRQEDRILLEVPLRCSVVYYDMDGTLRGQSLTGSGRAETALAPGAACRVTALHQEEPFCAGGPGGLELRCGLSLEAESYAREELRSLAGGRVEPLEEGEKRPGLLLRRTREPQELWDIAKACRSDPEAIARANDLQDPLVPAGRLLLIPM